MATKFTIPIRTPDFNLSERVLKVKAWKFMKDAKNLVNPKTGHINLKYNPVLMKEDFYIPVRKNIGENINYESSFSVKLSKKDGSVAFSA